jgi:hypothetical protein
MGKQRGKTKEGCAARIARNTLQGNILVEKVVEHDGVPPVKGMSRFACQTCPQPDIKLALRAKIL